VNQSGCFSGQNSAQKNYMQAYVHLSLSAEKADEQRIL
jgi:hypothetical protein